MGSFNLTFKNIPKEKNIKELYAFYEQKITVEEAQKLASKLMNPDNCTEEEINTVVERLTGKSKAYMQLLQSKTSHFDKTYLLKTLKKDFSDIPKLGEDLFIELVEVLQNETISMISDSGISKQQLEEILRKINTSNTNN